MSTTAKEETASTPTGSLDATKEGLQAAEDDQGARAKLRSWLGQILRIVITDGRIIVGSFTCTDRDGNVILENGWEYSSDSSKESPRMLYLTLIPGKHIISMSRMT